MTKPLWDLETILASSFKIILYYLLWENLNFFNYTKGLIFPVFLSSIKGLRQEQWKE